MDVTNENFKKLLPIVFKEIERADFLTIDGEFTGLSDGRRVNAFDTPAEYYDTLRTGSMDFLLVQFGLCIFKWDEQLKAFKHCGFNFYLFPGNSSKNGPEKIFQCQSSSMHFLAAQKFDFNKLFYNGISYLSTSEELQLKEKIEEKHLQEKELRTSKGTSQIKTEGHIPIPEEEKPQITKICEQVKAFIEGDSEECLELNVPNGFIRKLLYQEFETLFTNDISVETVTNEHNKRVLQVTKVRSAEELQQIINKKQQKDWENFSDAVGFSAVVRKISESGKLMVGHCLLLDLLHMLHQFFAPLPEDYQSFKDFTTCTFPSILDTMYLASIPELKDKLQSLNLEALLNTLSREPFNIPPVVAEDTEDVKGYSQNENKFHEAGYDAFTTGLCFLSLAEYLAAQHQCTIGEDRLNSESKLLKSHINKIYLFKTSYQDSPFIHLGGKEAIPSRSHVFHVTFPTKWRRTDLNELFSPFGGIYTSFIDENSAFVALRKRNLATKVLKSLRRNNSPYKLIQYDEFKRKTVDNPYKYKKPTRNTTVPSTDMGGVLDRSDKLADEDDVGEPVARDSLVSDVDSNNDRIINRRRNSSVNSLDGGVAPKRRRTSSGVFEILKGTSPSLTPDVKTSKKEQPKNLFNENNDWE